MIAIAGTIIRTRIIDTMDVQIHRKRAANGNVLIVTNMLASLSLEQHIIVSKSIKHYGEGMQSVVCMEELSELSQAISKEIRGVGDRSNLVEEMADVIICLKILKQIFAVTNVEIEEWVKFKQGRNLKRINCEKKD